MAAPSLKRENTSADLWPYRTIIDNYDPKITWLINGLDGVRNDRVSTARG